MSRFGRVPGQALLAYLCCASPALTVPLRSRAEVLDGGLDTTFGTGGKRVLDFLDYNYDNSGAAAVHIVNDEKILVTSLSFPFDLGGGLDDFGESVAIQSDGKILLAGNAQVDVGLNRDMALARLLPDGSLDTSFGVGGRVVVGFDRGDLDLIVATAIQATGRIVPAGSVSDPPREFNPGLIRLNATEIFADGFASGDVTSWSGTVPWRGSDSTRPVALDPVLRTVLMAGLVIFTLSLLAAGVPTRGSGEAPAGNLDFETAYRIARSYAEHAEMR